jgi:hypothetical protein
MRADDTGGVSTGELGRGGEPAAPVPELTDAELDATLRRLTDHGLVVDDRGETSDFVFWGRLRITPDGLRALGEWPPAGGSTLPAVLAEMLEQIAPALPKEDGDAARSRSQQSRSRDGWQLRG